LPLRTDAWTSSGTDELTPILLTWWIG
jgi:hypothetical protein